MKKQYEAPTLKEASFPFQPNSFPQLLKNISRRDFFAAFALAGTCANADNNEYNYNNVAKIAFMHADAMIEESEK